MPKEIKAHECDFCKTVYKRLHHAVAHEPKCSSNPNNHHLCLKHCKHLEAHQESNVIHRLIVHDGWDEHREDDGPMRTYFHCKFHKEKQLYTYRLEAKKTGFEYFKAEWGEDWVLRMPTTCEHYEDKNPNWKEDADAEFIKSMQGDSVQSSQTSNGDGLPF